MLLYTTYLSLYMLTYALFLGIRTCNSLERMVNNYRIQRRLNPITCHDKPRYLAQQHVYDLRQANSRCRGDLHEWKSSRYTGM